RCQRAALQGGAVLPLRDLPLVGQVDHGVDALLERVHLGLEQRRGARRAQVRPLGVAGAVLHRVAAPGAGVPPAWPVVLPVVLPELGRSLSPRRGVIERRHRFLVREPALPGPLLALVVPAEEDHLRAAATTHLLGPDDAPPRIAARRAVAW